MSPYSVHTRTKLTDVGYLLLEWVASGEMLSSSWQQYRHTGYQTKNLYRGIARTMLELANIPLPRIDSWTMDDKGVLTLTNRPHFDLTLLWNQAKVPTNIPRVRPLLTSTVPHSLSILKLRILGHDILQQNHLTKILSAIKIIA